MSFLHETITPAETEYRISERLFWKNAEEILQEHDTDALRSRVRRAAANTIDHNPEQFDRVLKAIETHYQGGRKLVDEAKVNHAYQVALLVAQRLGPRIHHDTFITALAHDLDEDTQLTATEITDMTSARIYNGIDALSHKTGGKPIYPGAKSKRKYFEDLLNAHREEPDLQILLIKQMDQLAVANGPLTRKELKSQDLVPKWRDMTQRKLEEMQLLHSMLEPEEANNARLLRQEMRFTQLRSLRTIGPAARVIFTHLPRRRQQL